MIVLKLNFKFKPLPLLIYSYMALPFIIFSFFMKWYFAVPAALITAVSVFLASSDSEAVDKIEISSSDMGKIIGGCIFIILLVALSGIGGVLWQTQDHSSRNGIFNALVEMPWPPKGVTAKGSTVGLCYYIGFWLPAAVVGKLTNLTVGYIFQMVWASLGIGLIWLLICSFHKKVVIYPLVIVLFFSGLDSIGYLIVTHMYKVTRLQSGNWASFGGVPPFCYHIEWWARYFQFSSHITQLFWVFNQALPVWLSTIVLIAEKNNKNLVFIMGLTLLSSTLPFVGLIPIFVWCAFAKRGKGLFDRKFTLNIDKPLFSMFTIQNVFGGGTTGILSFLYLSGNIASSATGSASGTAKAASHFSFAPFAVMLVIMLFLYFFFYKESFIRPSALVSAVPILFISYMFSKLSQTKSVYYLLFIIFELLIIAILVFPRYGQTSIYYIVLFSLLIIPFFKVGKSIDFCMRASIPLLFVMSLFAAFSLEDYLKNKKKALAAALAAVLMIGALTPMHEITRTVYVSAREIAENGKIKNPSASSKRILSLPNFTAKTDSGVFFKYLAK